MTAALTRSVKDKARQLGFALAGVTSSLPPAHYPKFEDWLAAGHHGGMDYLAGDRSRERRADPARILPECRSILVLGLPYAPVRPAEGPFPIASYARGADYHEVIPPRLRALVEFIEEQSGGPVPNRWYTDTGPLLERELAQRAGLGWIGRSSMLVHPRIGSTFFLAVILLGIELEADEPFQTDHCGSCTRCVDACPTGCILPNRTIDARRCISYLTIELKGDIPQDLRPQMADHVFGCDVCQQVCPWNRFSLPPDPAFAPMERIRAEDLLLTPQEFNRRFHQSPLRRSKRRGLLRNLAVAVGNTGDKNDLPLLEKAAQDDEALVREHADWAVKRIQS